MNYHELHQIAIDNEYEVMDMAKFHPRAWKLLKKRKPFLVVANDEPYYLTVYQMIKEHELEIGRWTDEDERLYLSEIECIGKRE